LLCLVPAVAGAAQPGERVLGLDDSIIAGLNNNQELLALKEQILIARQMVSEAKAQIYPKIDFNLSLARFDHAQPTVLPLSFSSVYLPAGNTEFYYSTRFSLWQYLYAGGRYTTNVRLSEINLSQAKNRADATRNTVIRDVKQAFYACLVSREKTVVLETALSAKALNTAAAGAAREAELAVTLAHARHAFAQDRLRFLHVAGLELDSPVVFAGELRAPRGVYALNKCLAWAFQFRPELQQTQYQSAIDSLRVNLSMTERYPTITLGANYEWIGETLPLDRKNWNATVNLNLPVFDGWASWARIRQRRNQAREGTIARARFEDQIRYEVRQAFAEYTFWQEQVAALEATTGLARTPDQRVSFQLVRLETVQKALASEAALEWAVGRRLDE
jgi:outer membrane protein TolC